MELGERKSRTHLGTAHLHVYLSSPSPPPWHVDDHPHFTKEKTDALGGENDRPKAMQPVENPDIWWPPCSLRYNRSTLGKPRGGVGFAQWMECAYGDSSGTVAKYLYSP